MSNAAQVIQGKEDWLFLKEGTNFSYSYLNGDIPIDHKTSFRWHQTIERRNRLFPNSMHLICPEKIVIYPEFVEGFRASESRLACNLSVLPKVLYPIQALRGEREMTGYSKVDTHFNDYGAYVTAKIILDEFGCSTEFRPEWEVISIIGDLGVMLNRDNKSDKIILKNPAKVRVNNNGLNNRGRITLYSNEAVQSGRMLIFGDSFSGINLARMLSNFLGEVLFVHSLSIDYNIVRKFNPDFILFEFAERFLREPPCDGLAIEHLIIEKILSGETDRVKKWKESSCVDNSTSRYIDWETLNHVIMMN